MERVFIRIDKQMLLESFYKLRALIDPINHEALDEWNAMLNMISNAPTTEDKSSGLPRITGVRK